MTALPTDPEELAALAGEYVLGTLDSRASRQVGEALPANPTLNAWVEAWEITFAPLSALATPEAPPTDLWTRIEQAIAPASAIRSKPAGGRFLRLWQGWAVAASLVAAGLAAVTLLPSQPPQQMTTVLLSDANQTAWTAEVDRSGGIRLATLQSAGGNQFNTAPSGKQLQLWALPPGATAPTSLGLVPLGNQRVSIPTPAVHPVPGMLILISLEPTGGAPGALPTGPVLFVGKLSPYTASN